MKYRDLSSGDQFNQHYMHCFKPHTPGFENLQTGRLQEDKRVPNIVRLFCDLKKTGTYQFPAPNLLHPKKK